MSRVVLCLLVPLSLAAQKPSVDFTRDVHPLLAGRCLACHSAEKRSGGLSLATYEDVLQGGRSGAAIVPSDAKGSLLMLRVTGQNAPQMPLGKSPLAPQRLRSCATGSTRERAARRTLRLPSRNGCRPFRSLRRRSRARPGRSGIHRSIGFWRRT